LIKLGLGCWYSIKLIQVFLRAISIHCNSFKGLVHVTFQLSRYPYVLSRLTNFEETTVIGITELDSVCVLRSVYFDLRTILINNRKELQSRSLSAVSFGRFSSNLMFTL
jgi:hypothetical protein